MSKYIDSEKLIAEIDKILAKAEKDEKKAFYKKDANGHLIAVTKTAICVRVKKIITSLQQEHPKVQNGKFVFPKYLYARTKDNKTIDMSYAPQDMTAVEYIRNDFVEQEQPEVDLLKALDDYYNKGEFGPEDAIEYETHKAIARHFYELGLNARKGE